MDDELMLEKVKTEARKRWGEEWAIDMKLWADGDRHFHAYHIELTNDPEVRLEDRLFPGSDGEVYHMRVRVQREEVLEVLEQDGPPEEIASEYIHEGEDR